MPSDPSPVHAAGGLLWRPARHGRAEIALVHRPRYKDWSLPKGKAVRGETPVVTAHREVLEETGFRSLIGRRLTLERYLELSHMLISPQGHGQGFVDGVLAQRGLSRRIALKLPTVRGAGSSALELKFMLRRLQGSK